MENVILKNRAVANIKLLIDSGQNQTELAELAGISRVQMNRIMNGHSKPELDTCEALALAFQLPPDSLLMEPSEFRHLLKENLVTSS